MSWIRPDTLVYTAAFLTIIELILGLYVLLLNVWHAANRRIAATLFWLALTTGAMGLQMAAAGTQQMLVPTIVLAATSVGVQPMLLVAALSLVRPGWLRARWLWWGLIATLVLPLFLTAVDLALGTGLWFTGLPEGAFGPAAAEAVPTLAVVPTLEEYAQGALAVPLRFFYFALVWSVTAGVLVYVSLIDRKTSRNVRLVAGLLLIPQVAGLVLQAGLRDILGAGVGMILSAAVFVLFYAYAAFQQMISERRVQRGRLHVRLTLLILSIVLPLFLGIAVWSGANQLGQLQRNADERLAATNRSLVTTTELWLDLSLGALQQMARLPDIAGMEADSQEPILHSMVEIYDHISLASTIGLDGVNVARSDGRPPANYRREYWHVGARNGLPVTFDVVLDEERGEPMLVMAVPIRRESGTIVGIAMVSSDLASIAREVHAARVGEEGFAYLVDGLNRVVAHADPTYTGLREMAYYPPVFALRSGERGLIEFTDEEGVAWRAYVDELTNGWGVIVQQTEADLSAPIRDSQRSLALIIGAGLAILLALLGLMIRQALRPIGMLTETAMAIAGGDLDREAPVESEDEIGALARTFNTMTARLRELIDSLEEQVADRTYELERRSEYLEATAEVAAAVGSILDSEQLVHQVVEMVRSRFDLYYVGLFVADAAKEWATLKAGTGAAGAAMVERGHRMRVGEGMIGWSIAHGEARVAASAEQDAIRLATPELPDTRSEAALPLRSRGRVLGALTVQHVEPGVFDENTMSVLQTMADQVALALDNAQLFAESQEALQIARRAYGEISRQTWLDLLGQRQQWAYRFSDEQITEPAGEVGPEMYEAEWTGQVVVGELHPGLRPGEKDGERAVAIPIKVRDSVVGVMGFRKKAGGGNWSREERQVLLALMEQLEVALESARLYQDTQQRAAREQMASELTARIRESLDMDTVLQTAVREMRGALNIDRVEVRLGTAGFNGDEEKA